MSTDNKESHKRSERRDAALNRQRILDAAIRLFNDNGVEHVSMNQIAKEAGIGSGTLYRRYSNKGELCHDLIKGNINLLFQDIDTYLADHQTLPPNDRLKGVLRLFIQFRENKIQLLKGVEDATAKNKSLTSSPLYHELHHIIVDLFDEMNEDGLLRRDSVFRADMLLVAFSSDSYLFQRNVRGHTPEMILEQIYLTFVLNC